jgi:DNA-binding MarR family transcriptional regulator
VLVVIDAEGPMSQRALGRRLSIDKSPMVGLLDDLERLELAERRRSESDRRVQAIHLTRAGRAALARVLEIAEAENARTFEPLDDAEREVLHDLLLRVAASASAGPLDLEARLLEVELVLDAAHDLAGDLAALRRPTSASRWAAKISCIIRW